MMYDQARPTQNIDSPLRGEHAPASPVERILCEVGDTHGAPGYNHDAAYLLSVASAWAYSDAGALSNVLARQGMWMNRCRYVGAINDALFVRANAYIIQSACRRLAILCFRGTEPTSLINWLTDVSPAPDPFYSIGYIHGGFYRNVIAVWPDIVDCLKLAAEGKPILSDSGLVLPSNGKGEEPSNGHNGKSAEEPRALEAFYIAGHSLGAAMAVIAAAMIFEDDRHPTLYAQLRQKLRGVYTFGQPMIGDRALADECDKDFGHMLFRHVYDHDIVTRMPPLTAGRFAHFGNEYRSTTKGWIQHRSPIPQVSTFLASAVVGVGAWVVKQLPLLSWIKLPLSWDDHSPLYYMRTSHARRPGSEFA